MFNEVTAVIPIRKGSTRVLGKNLRPFCSTAAGPEVDSLLSWKIRQLEEVISPENILVSSDWAEALEVASALGCKTHTRPDWLCRADAPFDEVICNIANQVRTRHLMWSPVTSPFVGPRIVTSFLENYFALDLHRQNHGQILTSEIRDYFYMSGNPLNFPLGTGHVQTQDIAPISRWSWALSARPTSKVIESKYMFSEYVTFFDSDILTTFDINDEVEFQMAQHLIDLYLVREERKK